MLLVTGFGAIFANIPVLNSDITVFSPYQIRIRFYLSPPLSFHTFRNFMYLLFPVFSYLGRSLPCRVFDFTSWNSAVRSSLYRRNTESSLLSEYQVYLSLLFRFVTINLPKVVRHRLMFYVGIVLFVMRWSLPFRMRLGYCLLKLSWIQGFLELLGAPFCI